MFKYIKHGVKRKHDILEGILPYLEEIAKIDGIKKVVPAKISYSPKRSISKLTIRIQREVPSGFKLLVHNKGGIQEIFIIINSSKRNEVEKSLKKYVDDIR